MMSSTYLEYEVALLLAKYGKNAVLGPIEPDPTLVASHEIFVLIDVVVQRSGEISMTREG